MSNHTYIITKMQDKIFSFLQSDKKAIEIHCDPEESGSVLGNIYIGRIQNIAKNINAAFVEIAPGQNCYLPLEDIKNPIYTKKGTSKLPQQGDELLVQISREGIKTKLPSVTTNLTLHGKYVLLTTGNTQISVSSKLSKEVRGKLLDFVSRYEQQIMAETEVTQASEAKDEINSNRTAASVIESEVKISSEKNVRSGENVAEHTVSAASARPFGWLLRTNAGTAAETLLIKDMQRLYAQYQALIQQAKFRTCFSCMLRTPQAYLTRLSNLYDSSVDRILTDDETLYKEIKEYLEQYQAEDSAKLTWYQDELLPLKKLYSLEHQLSEALDERVWLKCGGYLIIQPTEALTVIDVNSGKADGGKKKEAAILKVNKEAAIEIARQIRLRNLSGIIIVDFINMDQQESKHALLDLLDGELKKDPVRTVLVDMTKLSLVEITRMKRERPLAETIK